jgi:hypothetical protein
MARAPVRPARFIWAEGQVVISPCLTCRHKLPQGAVCLAFPTSIPEAILDAAHDHRTPFPGDHGLRYTPVEEV